MDNQVDQVVSIGLQSVKVISIFSKDASLDQGRSPCRQAPELCRDTWSKFPNKKHLCINFWHLIYFVNTEFCSFRKVSKVTKCNDHGFNINTIASAWIQCVDNQSTTTKIMGLCYVVVVSQFKMETQDLCWFKCRGTILVHRLSGDLAMAL